MMRQDKIEVLAKSVMNKLLQGKDIVLTELRKQCEQASIESYELTDTGFYLTFSLPANIPCLTEKVSNVKGDFCFGDVEAKIENLQGGASFLLWIKNGKLKMLEGYSYEETWPEIIDGFQLSYFFDTRNISMLRQQWLTL